MLLALSAVVAVEVAIAAGPTTHAMMCKQTNPVCRHASGGYDVAEVI
jgi:hypothetical protein